MRKKSIAEENSTSGIVCTAPWRLTRVSPLPDYILEVEFVDGTRGFVNLRGLIMSDQAGVFAALRDVLLFNQVHLVHGVATWPGEIDLAPDAMHQEVKSNGTWILTG